MESEEAVRSTLSVEHKATSVLSLRELKMIESYAIAGSRFSRYQNWAPGMPRGKRKLAALVMNRIGKWANAYADKPLTEKRTLSACKLVPL